MTHKKCHIDGLEGKSCLSAHPQCSKGSKIFPSCVTLIKVVTGRGPTTGFQGKQNRKK